MKKIYFLFVTTLIAASTNAQLDSIYDQSVWRTFIVHLPIGYSAINQYPLVINLHGLNSDAAQQESYSQFDNVADNENFIVVYPNGINNQWAVGDNTDVDFISHLIDTIRNNYSCNACLFATGISYGGFMTYKLACGLPQQLSAIAVVAGNMTKSLQNSCVITNGLPIMHFHGTADQFVNYNGVFPIIPSVDTTIMWWLNENNCNTTPTFTALPNINIADSCTAENYLYSGGTNGSVVSFYKIINGGHTWPGATAAPPLGFTNQDINASALIGSFFNSYCSMTTAVNDLHTETNISVFPNPASETLNINFTDNKKYSLSIYNAFGENVYSTETTNNLKLQTTKFANGIYFLQASNGKNIFNQTIIIAR